MVVVVVAVAVVVVVAVAVAVPCYSVVAMLSPAPLPRSLEASFRDVSSARAATRESALRDVVRHALLVDATRTRALPVLERALRDDDAPGVRAVAAIGLADLGGREALSTLLFAVEDDHPFVRQMALSALGELRDPRAAERLRRALSDARPEVRYQAVIAYARVAHDDADAVAAALAHALDDGDAAIIHIALRMAEEYEPGAPLRHPRLLARARELIASADDAVAVVAALYLVRAGEDTARSVVLDVVAERRGTPDLEDEQACVEVAGDLLLREAIPYLERRVWSRRRTLRRVLSWGAGDASSCAWHARTALARMGHARARAEILSDLASWRREKREAAVVAAGRARLGEALPALERLGGAVDADLLRDALALLAIADAAPAALAGR